VDEFNSGERNSVDDNLLAALCYWLCCFCGLPALIIFLLKKEESAFIKFHSLQALIATVAWVVISIVINVALNMFAMVPGIGIVIAGVASLGMSVVALGVLGFFIFVGIKAYNGEEFEIPILGSFIQEKFMN
jgi:uncharacterized membrane protein